MFLSTSFYSFSDFNIEEFCELSEILFKMSPKYREIPGYKHTCISPIVKSLYVEYLQHHTKDIKIRKSDVISFDIWRRQSAFSYCSLKDFSIADYKQINRKRRNYRKKKAGQVKSLQRRLENEAPLNPLMDFTVSSVEYDLAHIIALNDHASAIQYFKRCQYITNSLFTGSLFYPGCNFTQEIDGSNIWIRTIRSFISYRENRGLTVEGAIGNAKVLIDYIFFYLRFWRKLNENVDFILPNTPAEFSRTLHFRKRIGGEDGETQSIKVTRQPLTFLEIIEASDRRSTGYSINSAIEFVDQLFVYIIADKSAYPELKNKFIENPVHQKIDKNHVLRHKESTKEDIPEPLFYILRLYFESLESFGIMWLNQIISNPKSIPYILPGQIPEFLHAWEFGLKIPTFNYKGTVFEIDPIPNVFFFHWRTIKIKDGKLDKNGRPEKRFIPVLSALRLTYSIVGMALRGQSVQWLDREKFDSPNINNPTDSDYYLINVNTDKVKKEPWNTLCERRIRNVLLREKYWQLCTSEYYSNVAIKYEGRTNPPQEDILPLFRGAGKNPVSDTQYYKIWELAWMSLHSVISANADIISVDRKTILRGIDKCLVPTPAYPKGYESMSGMHVVTYLSKKTLNNCQDTKKNNFSLEPPSSKQHKRKYSKPTIAGDFCEIKYQKRYTPHCSRVSHVTILAEHGIPPELIEEVTGQTVPLVRYYTKNKQQQLISALQKTSIFDVSEPVHLQPSDPNSTMNTNLSVNVGEAILQHQFASFDLRDPSFRDNQDALTLLKAYGVDKCDSDDHRLCVAGGKCPVDALEIIKEPYRCALCHYGLYGIDHQPGILAKIEALRGECTAASNSIKSHQYSDSNQSKKMVKAIADKRRLDLLELSVYEKILNYLEQASQNKANDNHHFFYTHQPDVISQQLELRSHNGGLDEYLFLRFSQCREYGHLAIDQTLIKHANRLARTLSVKLDKNDTVIEDIPDTYTLIDLLWNQIVTIANIEGKPINQVHKELLLSNTRECENTIFLDRRGNDAN